MTGDRPSSRDWRELFLVLLAQAVALAYLVVSIVMAEDAFGYAAVWWFYGVVLTAAVHYKTREWRS